MTRGIGCRALFSSLCFLAFLSAAASPAPPAPAATPPPPLPSLPSATLTGTVQSVDARARTIEVVTGVGYALRVVKLAWEATVTLKAAAAGAGMAQLKPGDVIRVEYAKAPDRNAVRTIELLPSPAPQGVR
jgi:DNA-binding transcriptional LysR family regulator